MNIQKKIITQIKIEREKLGLSQESLAIETGLDRTNLPGIEKGDHNISVEVMHKICKALDIKASDLQKLLDFNIMKVIIMATFLSVLFSCGNKKVSDTNQTISTDTIVGSTLANINNSQHTVIQFKVDNKLCFATINQYFKNYKNKKSFPYSLWVTVETLEKNRNGHPVDSETFLFNKIEDSLINNFVEKTPFCFIGRTTRDGYRELMFYVSDKSKASELMNNFIKTNAFKRKIEFTIDPDPTWESVGGFY